MERCLSLTSPGWSVPDLAGLAAWSEERGYRTAWLSEVAGPDAFVLATATAVATSRLDLGVAVVPAYNRTPTALAMAAGSVAQVLGERRFRLGIGSSSDTIVEQWNGVPFERPLTRVRETVEAVRSGLDGSGEYQGSTVAMHRYRTASPPPTPVEIYVGALGPRMLAVAGKVGDGVCLNMMPPRVVPAQLAEVRNGAGDRPLADFGVMARLQVLITDDLAAARTMLRQVILGPYLAQPVYNRFLAWMGYPEEAAAIAAGWAAKNREAVAAAVHDRLVDDLTVIGSTSAVCDKLDAYADAGIRQAAISVLTTDRRTVEETLAALAP